MTRDEVKVLFRIIDATYPHTFRNDDVLSDAISVWAVIFAGTNAKLVESALYTYISEKNEFAPTPGHIKAIIERMENPNALSEVDAWNMVQRALSNGIYGAQEEFDKLPENVQKAIGSPHWLFRVANDQTVNMSVESSNFYKRYRQVIADKREINAMPPAVKKLVEELIDSKGVDEVAMIEDQRVATALDYERRRQEAVDRFMNPKPDEEIPDMQPKTFTRLQELKERLLNGRFNDTDTEHEIQPTT